MEPIGATLEGEWSSLSGMYTNEEADFMAQLLGGNCIDTNSNSSSYWSNNDQLGLHLGSGIYESSSEINHNMYNFSQGSSSCSGGSNNFLFSSSPSQESYYLTDSNHNVNNNNSMSVDLYLGDGSNTGSYLVETNDCSNHETSNDDNCVQDSVSVLHNLLPKKEEVAVSEQSAEDKSNSQVSKKRKRNAGDGQKTKRNVRSRKNLKQFSSNNDEDNTNPNGPASRSCCSEDESNASLESKGNSALNSSGKTRASRGAATDPQSIYARKRRERINERLKILQGLVPNGTKVDISTMLEEAVHYVKFLQLQIKLLSSDDLWMYAPLAFNGMDIGLDKLAMKL